MLRQGLPATVFVVVTLLVALLCTRTSETLAAPRSSQTTASPAASTNQPGATPGNAATGSLVVRTMLAERGPISDVSVVVEGARGSGPAHERWLLRSDANGCARHARLPVGRIVVRALGGGAHFAEVRAGGVTELTVVLPELWQIEGQVVDAEGLPVGAAHVQVRQPPLAFDETATSAGADGRFRLRMARGSQALRVGARALGFAASTFVECAPDPDRFPSLRLVLREPAPTLDGRILDANGGPLANATVTVGESAFEGSGRDESTGSVQRLTPAEDGGFRALGVQGERVRIEVRARGRAPVVRSVRVGALTPIEIRVDAGGRITGTVVDAAQKPLAGLIVAATSSLADAADPAPSTSTLTGADGSYELLDTPIGTTAVSVSRSLLTLATESVQLAPGAIARLDFVVTTPVLQGRLLDEQGRPWVGMCVRWSDATSAPGHRETATAEDGSFALAVPRPGSVVVEIAAHGAPFQPLTITTATSPGPELALVLERSRAPSAFLRGSVPGVVRGRGQTASVRVRALGVATPGEAFDLAFVRESEFRIGPLVPGDYEVLFAAPPDRLARVVVRELATGQTRDLGEIGLAQGAFVAVEVQAAAPSVERRGPVLVTITDAATGAVADAFPMSARHATSSRLAAGAYLLTATGTRDVRSQRVRFELRAGETKVVSVRTEPGIAVRLRVPVPSGALLPLALRLVDLDGSTLEELDSLAGGEAQATRAPCALAPGRLELVARDAAGRTWSAELRIAEAPREQDLTVRWR